MQQGIFLRSVSVQHRSVVSLHLMSALNDFQDAQHDTSGDAKFRQSQGRRGPRGGEAGERRPSVSAAIFHHRSSPSDVLPAHRSSGANGRVLCIPTMTALAQSGRGSGMRGEWLFLAYRSLPLRISCSPTSAVTHRENSVLRRQERAVRLLDGYKMQWYTCSGPAAIEPGTVEGFSFEPSPCANDLLLHWYGPEPLSLQSFICEDGQGELQWVQIPMYHPHPELPQHRFNVFPDKKPGWVLAKTVARYKSSMSPYTVAP